MMVEVPTWRATLGDWVATVAFAPDGTRLVAGSLAGDALVLDARTGEAAAKLTDHPLGVLAARWSPDGARLAVGGQDGAVHLYEADGRRVASCAVDGWAANLAWSPDGRHLAVGAKRAVTLIDRDGEAVARWPDHASTVTAVAWSADGTRLGAAAYGGVSWYDLADLDSSSPARRFTWKGSLLSLAMSPDGRWACGGAQDQSIHLWKLWSGKDLEMSGYPSKIEHLAFRHDSRWMASACLGELTVWDFGGRGPGGTAPAAGEAHDRHITTLAWQPAGDVLATGGADGRLVLWPSPRKAGRAVKPLAGCAAEPPVATLAWHPDGACLAVGRADGTVELRSIRS